MRYKLLYAVLLLAILLLNDRVVLYPTDCTSLIESLKAEQGIVRT